MVDIACRTTGRVHTVDVHVILCAVECHHHQRVVHTGIGNVGHIVLSSDGHIHLRERLGRQVIVQHSHFSVFLSGHRIFVIVGTGIKRVTFIGVAIALIKGH